jgi:hypothetical protein
MYTHTHTYILWIHKCVTKTLVRGTSHKYANIHNFYSLKYYKIFYKEYYRSSLHVNKSSSEEQMCVFKYFLKAASDFTF